MDYNYTFVDTEDEKDFIESALEEEALSLDELVNLL